MHWFGLTDSDLWLSVGNKTLFEYTDDALRHWSNMESQIALAITRDWGHTVIDKVRVIEEQIERKMNFNKHASGRSPKRLDFSIERFCRSICASVIKES